jgi:hypothetical protein
MVTLVAFRAQQGIGTCFSGGFAHAGSPMGIADGW